MPFMKNSTSARRHALKPSSTVLAFGEIMMRLTPPNERRIEQATSFDVWYGGTEANMALSLSYQGDHGAFVSVVPPNRIGDCALRYLSSYGVDISRVIRAGDRLGVYFFENGASARSNGCVYDRKYSAANLAKHTDFDWDKILRGVDCFYFTGVTPAVSDELARACKDALRACRAKGIVTACDLNYRGKLWSADKARSVMTGLLPFVDICFAHDEDAAASLGIGSRSLASGLEQKDAYIQIDRDIISKYGCRSVATVVRNVHGVEHSLWQALLVTDGGKKVCVSPIHHVHVLEGVGGGDAFGAGFMHAVLHGFNPQQTIDYAIAASVLKLTVRGDANLVTKDEIDKVVESVGGQRVSR